MATFLGSFVENKKVSKTAYVKWEEKTSASSWWLSLKLNLQFFSKLFLNKIFFERWWNVLVLVWFSIVLTWKVRDVGMNLWKENFILNTHIYNWHLWQCLNCNLFKNQTLVHSSILLNGDLICSILKMVWRGCCGK